MRLVNLTIWKPISFGGEGSVAYFTEPQHRIELEGLMVRIEGSGDVALLPFGDNIARSTPWVERAPSSERPFVKASQILQDQATFDQKFAYMKGKSNAPK